MRTLVIAAISFVLAVACTLTAAHHGYHLKLESRHPKHPCPPTESGPEMIWVPAIPGNRHEGPNFAHHGPNGIGAGVLYRDVT